jgi:glutamate synthase domain-containing protein 2/glutamate synthase domain-containing protein 1/glutamate synthase domain-containing protein 3
MRIEQTTTKRRRYGLPEAQGLYHPGFEHDACGVGMICNLKGTPSHSIIESALHILDNLSHRGACGCDEKTGDGAGILMQTPHAFLTKVAGGEGIRLGDAGDYAAALVFLPRTAAERAYCKEQVEAIVKAEGQVFLGWRQVPVHNEYLGDIAREVEPKIEMMFVGRGPALLDAAHFDRKLYVIRKLVERAIRESKLEEKNYFYISSLSTRTLVYKGLLLADQIKPFFPDLTDPDMVSGLALVHQRYSTNTFPTWDLAQPFRFLCHNGEINTVRGNTYWMDARQYKFKSDLFGADIEKLFPIITPGVSDSAALDNALELLYHTGRSLPHAMMMLIPEAWQNHATMDDDKRAFYEYHASLMEPWDGPASIPFSDGKCIGALLDRNGLRPSRYTVTKDGLVIMGSETGVIEVDPANVQYKGRLQPGKMFLVDTEQGRIIDDEEIKSEMAARRPYRAWLNKCLIRFDRLPLPSKVPHADFETLQTRQKQFGYTLEDMKIILSPMAKGGKEAIGSMGDDTPLAVLSNRPRLLYDYFKQLFAQVTNPPLDAIREELVTSLHSTLGARLNLFEESADHCHQFRVDQPILSNRELAQIRDMYIGDIRATTLPILFKAADGAAGMKKALDELFDAAVKAVDDGATILVLSDRGASEEMAPIPALLASAGVHHHLIREHRRVQCNLVLESGEPREVHHFCTLIGYGIGAINPYLAFETIEDMIARGSLPDVPPETAKKQFIKAVGQGMLKVMSKMGISTLKSYHGAQIFEAIGLHEDVIDRYFTATASRIGGVGLETLAEEALMRQHRAYPDEQIPEQLGLDVGGLYQWRRNGEYHQFNPLTVAKLQQATKIRDEKSYMEYANLINEANAHIGTLRGLLEFKEDGNEIPLDEVEPWTEIVKRFKTGAMSYGSISKEAHESLAIAMNEIGGKSNSGEGGEDEDRFLPDADGKWRNSAIKQIASGRFGVTSHYLVNAKELQIKMAQGAKPGEGGQLPGEKVFPEIAKTRHSTPYVGLISPPPHHDIYSIEDLAQLIHDLKNANPEARVNVKLVSEVGVGTVAAGVSKGKADVVLISGADGGTGASPQSSLKHAGLPWELGLAETHQTLVLNDLRSRIVVECDGQMKTGRDVAVACLLGAEEFGFSTAPLVVMGCIMMRVCHLNTCPVGIATQNPELRKKFTGQPDHVINYFYLVAQELRRYMAQLGFRTINEMIGRVDKLKPRDDIQHWKARGLDFTKVLTKPNVPASVGVYCTQKQDHGLANALDNELIVLAKPALENGERVEEPLRIRNINRTVGTMLSSQISKRYGAEGLPEDTIIFHCSGSGGQSFCAFGAAGLTMHVHGDANDYFGKGLSGAKLTIRPPKEADFVAEENIIIGNVAFYGATSGEAYIRGLAGERFCVRNSGVHTVVEGVGDHGCEYMTGGRVVVLGPTGRNFAAGMSGGIAYVYDRIGDFGNARCNLEMVELEPVVESDDIAELRGLIEKHIHYTDSALAKQILDGWSYTLTQFVKVMPTDYRKALERLAREAAETQEPAVMI